MGAAATRAADEGGGIMFGQVQKREEGGFGPPPTKIIHHLVSGKSKKHGGLVAVKVEAGVDGWWTRNTEKSQQTVSTF